MIDRDIHLARALLVEGNPLLRSVAAAQLRDTGVGHVTSVNRVKDARLLLEREHFDIVLCNREFEDSDYSGQDLLDELRREKLLPHSTVFLMVTAQASYNQVVEAAESALDGFLVRPYTAATLGTKLLEARNRKRELAPVLRALDDGQSQVALVHAIKRFQEQQPYWAYCGRLAAELMMTMQRPEDARRLFEHLVKAKPTATWAHLGVARAQAALGDNAAARRTVQAALAQEPGSADAHDLMGRLWVEQCDFEAALTEYQTAAGLTPGCLLRNQHAGALAFYQGHADDALKFLERTLGMGSQSKLFDPLSLLLIAMLRFDRSDATQVAAMREQLRRQHARQPESARLGRFEKAADALAGLMSPKPEATLPLLREFLTDASHEQFDLEAANIALSLWERVPANVRPAADYEALIERIALRFCTSKAVGEVLCAAARRADDAVAMIRRCQAQLLATTEKAMEHGLKGEPALAVQMLLEEGERTLNAKLLEMAALLARKHAAVLPDAEALGARASELVRRTVQSGGHIAGIQRSGRSPGGLQLRGHAPTEPASPVAPHAALTSDTAVAPAASVATSATA
jgi:tetratricopeptide (TPR) repeat protein